MRLLLSLVALLLTIHVPSAAWAGKKKAVAFLGQEQAKLLEEPPPDSGPPLAREVRRLMHSKVYTGDVDFVADPETRRRIKKKKETGFPEPDRVLGGESGASQAIGGMARELLAAHRAGRGPSIPKAILEKLRIGIATSAVRYALSDPGYQSESAPPDTVLWIYLRDWWELDSAAYGKRGYSAVYSVWVVLERGDEKLGIGHQVATRVYTDGRREPPEGFVHREPHADAYRALERQTMAPEFGMVLRVLASELAAALP